MLYLLSISPVPIFNNAMIQQDTTVDLDHLPDYTMTAYN